MNVLVKTAVAVVAVSSILLTAGVALAGKSTANPHCTDLGKVRVCLHENGQVVELDRIRQAVDLVLVDKVSGLKPYPRTTLHFINTAVLRVYGYYLDPHNILIGNLEMYVADDGSHAGKAIYAVVVHELWHHRLTTWGTPTDEQHCAMGVSEEYVLTLKTVDPEETLPLGSHLMNLIASCPVFGFPDDLE